MSGQKQKDIAIETTIALEEAAEYLHQLAGSLKSGTVHVEQGPQSITVHPGQMVRLKMKAKQKDDKESLSIKVSWQKTHVENGRADLSITDTEPQKEQAEQEEQPAEG